MGIKMKNDKYEWIDDIHGTGCTLQFGYGFNVKIEWDTLMCKGDNKEPFIIFINRCKLQKRFFDYNEAKVYAIEAAERILDILLNRIVAFKKKGEIK